MNRTPEEGTNDMRKTRVWLPMVLAIVGLVAMAADGAWAQGPQNSPRWPNILEQLKGVRPGSPLEQLIRGNQDVNLLHPNELNDGARIPIWLRIIWKKAHPELKYEPDDPLGGYPLVLREVVEWMMSHQNLEPGAEEGTLGPVKIVSVTGEQRISGTAPNPRSESDIQIDFNNPQRIIAASNNIGGNGRQAHYFSSNGGASWGQTFLPLVTGDAFNSDPTVDWHSNGTALATTIGINSAGTQLRMRSFTSTDGGATWVFETTFSGAQTSADKQLDWLDKSAASPFKDNFYVCWHNGLPQFVARRTAAGVWGAPIQISGAESTGTAIGCDVKTAANGNAFVFWPTTGNRRIVMARSTNGGSSWLTPQVLTTTVASFDIAVPSFANRQALIYASAGINGNDNIVVAYTDLSGETGCTAPANEPGTNVASTCKSRIKIIRSTDGGTTWSAPVMINNQPGLNDQYNQALSVDPTNGTFAIVYYDTVADPGRKKTHLYYQSSTDNGATWSAPFQVTTAQTDESIAGADSGNQYGDYNAISSFNALHFASWTDRRGGAREEIWTAAIADNATPCTPPAAPTGVSATPAGTTQINLSWSAVAGATEYRVYRSLTSGGPYNLVGTTAGTSFSNTGLTCGTTYFYVVRAFAGCESVNSAQVSATTANCLPCNTTTLYTNGFETGSGLSDWTVGTFVAGGNVADWRGIQTCTAQTGTKIFRFGGNNCTANYGNGRFAFAQPRGATGIAVPAGSTTTRLAFGHRRRFESGFDGLTLAISVNGTNYFLIPASAIISGASYNGTTSTACPPAGAGGVSVFTGIQTAFVSSTIDLDAACNIATGGTTGCAGQAVRVAFTSITDCSQNDDGAFLDNVTVTACTIP